MTAVWRAFFACSSVLLVLLGLSVPFVRPGTPSFVASLLSLAMVGVMFVGSATFIYLDWNPFADL